MLLDEYKLSIPKVSIDDWQRAIESATGLAREILTAQADGAGLLQNLKETVASTERIGWLNIWSKAFAALEAVAAAVTHNSNMVLLLTQRNTFEVMLQMHTIMDPLRMFKSKSHHSNEQEYALRSCIDRLRAYTAWCLWHDKAYYKEVLNPKSMRDIWNFEFFNSMQKKAETAQALEQFLENVDMPLDEKTMVEGSRSMRKMYTEKIRQIEEWMADPKLKRWSDNIDRLASNNIVGIPFFILFDRADASIPKRLLKEGLRFSYASYIFSSMASHGSSMQEFVNIQNNLIKPVLTGDSQQINTLASEVIFRCQHIFTLLETINREMMKNPNLRS